MQINITGRQLDITPALKSYVENKIQRIEKYFDHVTNVHVILEVDKQRHNAEATIHVTGGDIYADAQAEDMYAAIDALTDKLIRQVQKHKEKVVASHHSYHDKAR